MVAIMAVLTGGRGGRSRRKIRLIEGNAKCRHLKKFTCKGTLIPPPPLTHCIRVYSILIHTGKGGGWER